MNKKRGVTLEAFRIAVHEYVLKNKTKEGLMKGIQTVIHGKTHFSQDVLDIIPIMPEIENGKIPLTEREGEILKIFDFSINRRISELNPCIQFPN